MGDIDEGRKAGKDSGGAERWRAIERVGERRDQGFGWEAEERQKEN